MADKESRKQMISAYKERSRTQAGGIYVIRNTANGKIFLDASPDIAAIQNRFEFAKQMGSCVHVKLSADWSRYGGDAFEFEVMETLEKNEDQSPAEFREDLDLLKIMWTEKYDPALLY